MVDQSPTAGHPDYEMIGVATPEARRSVILAEIDRCRDEHDTPQEILHCLLLSGLGSFIVECVAIAYGEPRDEAVRVGEALTATIMAGTSVNVRMVQYLGDVANLCDDLHSTRALPPDVAQHLRVG